MTSAYIVSNLQYQTAYLTEDATRAIAGVLTHGLFLDQPIPVDKFANIVEASDFSLNVKPSSPVLKMSKSSHVDRFFEDDSIRLGSFGYFNQFDHPEIGDPNEGSFILISKGLDITAFVEIAGGFNYLAFCCFTGEPDQTCGEKFSYDAAFEIVDIEGFSLAIQNAIDAQSHLYGSCLYSKDRVIRDSAPVGFDFSVISAKLLDSVSEAKYFLKPIHLSHQSEFRFLWKMDADFSGFIDIKAPKAIQFCSRVLET